jgi:hypothetical protein
VLGLVVELGWGVRLDGFEGGVRLDGFEER